MSEDNQAQVRHLGVNEGGQRKEGGRGREEKPGKSESIDNDTDRSQHSGY